MKHSLCHSHAFSGAVHRGLCYGDAPYCYDVAAHQAPSAIYERVAFLWPKEF